MSENHDSKVLYISGGGDNNPHDATTTQPPYMENENNLENETNSVHADDVVDKSSESMDGGAYEHKTDDDEILPKDNFDDEHVSLFGGAKKDSNKAEEEDFTSSDSDSDDESIKTCDILKIDPLMIRLNCFLKSESGETIVEILKDIRDELSILNKSLTKKNSPSADND